MSARGTSTDDGLDVTIVVPMEPKPKGRPRVVNGHAHTPAATRRWESSFAQHVAWSLPRTIIDEPVRVDLLFVLPRPARLLRKSNSDGLLWAPVRPDRDNLEKAVMDALRSSWRDDALVVCGEALKCYAERYGKPRVVLRIRSARDWDPRFVGLVLGLVQDDKP